MSVTALVPSPSTVTLPPLPSVTVTPEASTTESPVLTAWPLMATMFSALPLRLKSLAVTSTVVGTLAGVVTVSCSATSAVCRDSALTKSQES